MGAETILLVEDNADDVFLTVHGFRRSGISHQVVVARDGVEALDLLLPSDGTPGVRPVIVLLDLNMPRMGGLELGDRLRADPRTETLPVIMLTTSDDDLNKTSSYRGGANGYVHKPVSAEEFVEAATALGVFWLRLNCQPAPAAHA